MSKDRGTPAPASPHTAAGSSELALCRRLLRQARPFGHLIAMLFLLGLLAPPLDLLAPLPVALVVDSVAGSRPLPGLLGRLVPHDIARSRPVLAVLAAGLMIGIALARQGIELGASLLRTYTGERMVLDLRAALFRHVQRLSLAYHDARGSADSTYRIQYDATSVQYIFIDGVVPLVTAALTLAGMIVVTARLDAGLALVALAVSPLLFLIARAHRNHLRGQAKEVKRRESDALNVVHEVLGALRVVKAFGREDREQSRFVASSREGMRARLGLILLEGSLGLLVGLTTAAGMAAALYIGTRHVLAGSLTLGALLLVMAYIGQLYEPLRTIGRKAASLQTHLASAERAFALLDEHPDVAERPNALPLARARGSVAFRDVSFAYPDGHPVLHGVSFEVGPGTRVGIAGATGAGKTTLLSLLVRFYDPTSGTIAIDGVDLRDYRLADLRNQFAIVLQDSVLFSTSIAENIAYARPGCTETAIIAAAKAADAHDFITRLPNGYDTRVGERGMRLSGGERQRIALARAFLKDAPILILDEPTSSVDVRTEAAIMKAMRRLMRGRTTFMIAHRLSTLDGCDVRLEVEGGRLVTPASARARARGASEMVHGGSRTDA